MTPDELRGALLFTIGSRCLSTSSQRRDSAAGIFQGKGGVSKFSLLARLGWVSAICNQEVMTAIIEPALFLHCYSYVCDHFFSV